MLKNYYYYLNLIESAKKMNNQELIDAFYTCFYDNINRQEDNIDILSTEIEYRIQSLSKQYELNLNPNYTNLKEYTNSIRQYCNILEQIEEKQNTLVKKIK